MFTDTTTDMAQSVLVGNFRMGIFKQIGAALGRKTKDSVATTPSIISRMKAPFDIKSQVDKIAQNKEDAFAELEKIKLAPVRVERSADHFSEEEIEAKLRSLEMEKATPRDFLSMLSDVDISKPKELEEIDRALHPRASNKYAPGPRSADDEPKELPRGKAYPPMLVDIIFNHQMNPGHWNVENISDETRLRASDVEMFLKNFDLINEHANIYIEGQGENAIAGEDQFSPVGDMQKQSV